PTAAFCLSSRRRHTRFPRDWSSDVCSSDLDGTMLASYWLMVAAVVLRVVALWPSAFSGSLLHATATAWILAFGLYLYRYVPMLIRPRADAKPQPKPAPAAARPASPSSTR